MNIPEINVGDRIRITAEGDVTAKGAWSVTLRSNDNVSSTRTFQTSGLASVEILEPKYVPGAVYVDKDGDVFRYDRERSVHPWTQIDEDYALGAAHRRATDYPTRPLLRIDR